MPAHISPGVFWNEIDLSSYVPALSRTVAAIVGTASKGPINERIYITTARDLIITFGPPSSDHMELYTALEYLKIGKELWYTRVESGATAAAVATIGVEDIVDPSGTASITLNAKSKGSFFNDKKVKFTHVLPLNAQASVTDWADAATAITADFTTLPIVPNTIRVQSSTGVVFATDDGNEALTGTGVSAGTINYLTGAVSLVLDDTAGAIAGTNAVVVGSYFSAFSAEIFETVNGGDIRLEYLRNMSIQEGRPDDYRVVFGQSNFLAVPTLAADAALTEFPKEQDVTLTGGNDGTTGIGADDYIGAVGNVVPTGLQLYRNAGDIDLNVLACSGKGEDGVVRELISIAEARRDLVVLPDSPIGLAPSDMVDWANGANAYDANNAINSSYAALYYPWVKIGDPYNRGSEDIFIPPSGFALATFARTDHLGRPWDAPAGLRFGRLPGVLGTERFLSEGDRTILAKNRINPISDFITHGVMIWGHYTAQTTSSKLDRLGTRRFLLLLEKVLVTHMFRYIFRAIDEGLYAEISNSIDPVLASYVSNGALEKAILVCDDSNNTDATKNQNTLVAEIRLIPPSYADVILLNFVILESGADIEERIVGRQTIDS